MKTLPLLLVLGVLAACAEKTLPLPDKEIQGFGSIKLGQSLTDARSSLERDHLFYAYTGRTLDYQTTANDEHWFVSAQLIKTRVAGIVVSARPQVPGLPLIAMPATECIRRFDRAKEVLRQEYGSESSGPDNADDLVWIVKDRSVTLRHHQTDSGCDVMAIIYDDHSVADHF